MSINLDRMIYLVISDYNDGDGPFVREAELSRTDFVTVCKGIRDGQYENLVAVIELNPVEHTCREVTSDIETLIPEPK